MARPSRLRARSDLLDDFGPRLARLRKERGFTQVELAEKVGLIQALISDYETGKLRPYADTVALFAEALDVTTDEILGLQRSKNGHAKSETSSVSRRFLRRLQQVSTLPKRDQDALLRTIDAFLAARKAS